MLYRPKIRQDKITHTSRLCLVVNSKSFCFLFSNFCSCTEKLFCSCFQKAVWYSFHFCFWESEKTEKSVWYSFHFCFWKNEKRRWGERGEKRRIFFSKTHFICFQFSLLFSKTTSKFFEIFFQKLKPNMFSIFSTQKLKNSFWVA